MPLNTRVCGTAYLPTGPDGLDPGGSGSGLHKHAAGTASGTALSVCLSVCLSVYLSVYLSVCLSVCLFVCLSSLSPSLFSLSLALSRSLITRIVSESLTVLHSAAARSLDTMSSVEYIETKNDQMSGSGEYPCSSFFGPAIHGEYVFYRHFSPSVSGAD